MDIDEFAHALVDEPRLAQQIEDVMTLVRGQRPRGLRARTAEPRVTVTLYLTPYWPQLCLSEWWFSKVSP
jgi:hypothetical protein